MGIFSRMWRVIKGWLLIGVEKAEDPEVILTEAQDAMRRELDRARENAVVAIQQRNQLRMLLQDQQNKAAELEAQARQALKMGKEDLARQLLVEKGNLDQSIATLNGQMAQADKVAEDVKDHIRVMEQQVRQRAAEKLRLVAGWKQAQIQEKLNKALDGMSLQSHDEKFRRAEEKINAMQAKAEARLEMSQGGLKAEMRELQSAMASGKADTELERMKAEMGLSTPAPVTTTTQPATGADAELERLRSEISTPSSSQTEEAPRIRNIEV